jgi:hypothetical protein
LALNQIIENVDRQLETLKNLPASWGSGGREDEIHSQFAIIYLSLPTRLKELLDLS